MGKIGSDKHYEIQRTVSHNEEFHTGYAEYPFTQNIGVNYSMVNKKPTQF